MKCHLFLLKEDGFTYIACDFVNTSHILVLVIIDFFEIDISTFTVSLKFYNFRYNRDQVLKNNKL